MPDQNPDPYHVPGLLRGLRALEAFSLESQSLGLSEIARALGVSRSAAFRTVHTLHEAGYLLRSPQTGKYSLGPAVMKLSHGFHAGRELVEAASPVLENLRDRLDWSVHLGVRDGRNVLYLLRFASQGSLSTIVHVGSRLPAALTSMGRVLLSELDAKELRRLFEGRTEEHRLRRILANAKNDRGRRSITHLGAFESGVASVAAPVRDASGAMVAAINATRVTDHVADSVIEDVEAAAAGVSRLMGRISFGPAGPAAQSGGGG